MSIALLSSVLGVALQKVYRGHDGTMRARSVRLLEAERDPQSSMSSKPGPSSIPSPPAQGQDPQALHQTPRPPSHPSSSSSSSCFVESSPNAPVLCPPRRGTSRSLGAPIGSSDQEMAVASRTIVIGQTGQVDAHSSKSPRWLCLASRRLVFLSRASARAQTGTPLFLICTVHYSIYCPWWATWPGIKCRPTRLSRILDHSSSAISDLRRQPVLRTGKDKHLLYLRAGGLMSHTLSDQICPVYLPWLLSFRRA